MAKFLWLVLTNPADGAEQEYNRWYDEEHMPDMLSVEGVASVRRFQHVTSVGPEPGQGYLAVYEVEAESPEAVLAAFSKALEEPGRIRLSPALDPDTRQWFFRPIGPLTSQG